MNGTRSHTLTALATALLLGPPTALPAAVEPMSTQPNGARPQEAVICIQADEVLHPVSRLLAGACIEDVNHEVYGGIYSQMIFGESFQEPAPAPCLRGFKVFGGNWIAGDGGLRIDAEDGPKLISRALRSKMARWASNCFSPSARERTPPTVASRPRQAGLWAGAAR